MTIIEVLLLILGFVFVSLSFLIGTRYDDKKEKRFRSLSNSRELWTEKDEEMIRERIDSAIKDSVEEVIEKTTDQMNHICNDKIMAVDEFSNQVLDKIENNHKEVVFMYNMLDKKEQDMKVSVMKRTTVPTKKVDETEVVLKKPVAPKVRKEEPDVSVIDIDDSDINSQIIKLHENGKTILEISRELNMGQGEVKLVVDLYGGKHS